MLERETEDFLQIKNSLIDRLILVFVMLAVFAVAASLYRMVLVGFLPLMAFHIGMLVSFAAVYVFRGKLSINFKGHFIVWCLFLAGASGLFNFGLSGAGTLLMITASVIAVLVNTTSLAFMVVALGSLVQISVFVAINYLDWQLVVAATEYQKSAPAWANNLGVYICASMIITIVINKFFSFLKSMSQELKVAVEQKSVELEHSEILLTKVLNSLPFGVLWKDTNLRFLGANKRFLDDVNVKHFSEIEGKRDSEVFMDIEHALQFEKIDQEVLDTGEERFNHVVQFFDNDGEERFSSTNKIILRDKVGKVVGILSTYSDITETRNMENALRDAIKEAEQASKAKSDFLATMSHEIRTPINGVMGLLELALETELTPTQKEYISKAELSAHTLLHIINQILDISKIEAGKMEIERMPFSIADVLAQLDNQLRHMAEAKGLAFDIITRGKVDIPVSGDPTKLLQILVNLTSNAIKFTKEGSVVVTVTALVSPTEMKLRAEVTDTGIGIESSKQASLFDAFSQADSSTSRKYGGTGLGLAIVNQLLHMQGGQIDISSEPDKGTKFIFLLNYELAAEKVVDTTSKTSSNLFGVDILLAEDNEINQMIAREMLQQAGASVTVAEDGVIAVKKVREGEFDLVLMDIQMPNMDGTEALKEIKSDPENSNLPVVALTANVLAHEVKHYKEIGFCAHLGKPFQKEQLVQTINQFLKHDCA